MDSNSLSTLKSRVRDAVRTRVAAMDPASRADASRRACDRLAADARFRGAQRVMLYMPLRDELDVTPLAQEAFRQGKSVSMPRADPSTGGMTAVGVATLAPESMTRDAMGVRTPDSGPEMHPDDLDLVVVPGMAFDAQRRRLGRGGGYYDRFLSTLPARTAKAGICFDEQLVEAVPCAAHDRTLDAVFTPTRQH